MNKPTNRACFYAACSFVLLLVAAVYVLGNVPVCHKCGYENAEGRLDCSHCGTKLPDWSPKRSVAKPNDGALAEREWKETFLDGEFVEEEIQLAGSYYSEGNVEVARLFARNAMALDLLTKRGLDPNRAAKIASFLERCRTRTLKVSRKCSGCDGTGKLYRDMMSIGGDTRRREVLGKKCAECGGSGSISAFGTVNERKFRAGQAWRSYETAQRGRQYVAIGNAWVPEKVAESIGARQKASLLSATASPCEDCVGFGRIDCEDCRGTGMVKCTNRHCVDGISRESEKGKLVKGAMTRSSRCRVCEGRGHLECEDCGGKGSFLCDECNGTGERPVCSKCSGQGVAACRRCKGAGVYKGTTCEYCRGEGQALCRTCDGDGHK